MLCALVVVGLFRRGRHRIVSVSNMPHKENMFAPVRAVLFCTAVAGAAGFVVIRMRFGGHPMHGRDGGK